MDFMKIEIKEATRMTREGRLAEAAALIRRNLGLGVAPVATRARVVEVPPIDVVSSSAREPVGSRVPPATEAQADAKTAGHAGTGERAPFDRASTAPAAPPALSALLAGLPKLDSLGKVQARGRS